MNTNRAEYLPHEGVMLEEISSIIKDVPTGNFVDATYGFGSHFNLSTIHDHLNFIGFDRDLESINNSNNVHNVYHLNFSDIYKFLSQNNHLPLSGIMYDFGLSSHQIDSKHRGFSFQNNSPLDMRMDMLQDLSAASIVNNYSEEKLTKVLKAYSEDRYSNKISKKIKADDGDWKQFTSKLAIKTSSPILPIFFEGENSQLFHIANKIGQTFRYSLMMYELKRKIGDTINLHFGKIIPFSDFEKIDSLIDKLCDSDKSYPVVCCQSGELLGEIDRTIIMKSMSSS